MKKKKSRKIISIDNSKYTDQWSIAQDLGKFNEWRNRLPDAAEVSRQRFRSVPKEALPMIF